MSKAKPYDNYETGFRDGERSERGLRARASRLVAQQRTARRNQNKNLRNQARTLIGEWFGVYSKKRWADSDGADFTVEGMAQEIVNNWTEILEQLITELQRQMLDFDQESERELNKGIKEESERVKIKEPDQFGLLIGKVKNISMQSPYKTVSIKRHIRPSKPPHLVAGRPRKRLKK